MSKYRLNVRLTRRLVAGEMIDSFAEVAAAASDEWIMVEETSPGVYELIDNSMLGDAGWYASPDSLGFAAWDDTVEDLDAGNSEEVEFTLTNSSHLLCGDVDLNLATQEFRAPSTDSLQTILNLVVFNTYDSADI